MLSKIQNPVKKQLKNINVLLKSISKRDIALITTMQALTPIDKGKKIRPTLFYLLAECCNVPLHNLDSIASSIEMLHLSSLIHDDIVDN